MGRKQPPNKANRLSFLAQTPSQRRAFLIRHRGFLARVADTLRAENAGSNPTTICRTWNAKYKTPNPVIAAVIDREYRQTRQDEPRKPGRRPRKAERPKRILEGLLTKHKRGLTKAA